MNLEKYEIIKGPGDSYYEFYSEGPKGRIKKIVRFTPLSEYEDDFYNLYLGGRIDHRSFYGIKTSGCHFCSGQHPLPY